MYEVFVMSLREYWNELGEVAKDVDESIAELQEVLSSHFEKEVNWVEPELDPAKANEEIDVDIIDELQLSSLHAVAAKLELDGNLEGLELDPEDPWENEVFERLTGKGDADGAELEHYIHILSLGNSAECFVVPADLPFVAQINVNDDDEEDDCECEDDCDDCDCYDENSVDISSQMALRRELNKIAKALELDTSLKLEECESLEFDDEDDLRYAKLGWYILSARLDEAIKAKLPLIIRYVEDEELDDIDDEDEE